MNILDKLIYRSPGTFNNPLMWPFLLYTGVYGVAMTFFTHTATVQANQIYQLTVSYLPILTIDLFGVVLMVVTVANLVSLVVRKGWLGTAVSMTGFLTWTFAFFLLLLNGFYFQVLVAPIPQMMFWGWYYYTINRFHKDEEVIVK